MMTTHYVSLLRLTTAALIVCACLCPLPAASGQDQTPEESVPDGFALLEKGELEKALAAFCRAIEADPACAPLNTGAGRAALALGDYGEAIGFLTRALELDPASYDAMLYAARAFMAQGRDLFYSGQENDGAMILQDAAAMFSAAADMNKTAVDPLLDQAAILVELYDFEGADAAATAALERQPDCVQALLVRGDAAFMRFQAEGASGSPADVVKEKWHEAMIFYKKAGEIDAGATGPYLGMASLYEADKKWDEASDSLMKALVLNPELLQGYNKLIALFGNAEGREKLVSLLTTLVAEISRKFPGDEARKATPFYYAGFAHFLNFDYEASIEAYTASLKSNPAYRTGATYYIARSRFALNDFDNAARDFYRILSSDPDGFEYFLSNDPGRENVCIALTFLSNHCYEKENLNMARDLISGILLVKKDSAVLYNNYAFLCRETKKYEEAYDAYREALSLEPDNPSILNDTALILHYHLHRDKEYAEELYGRAIEEAQRILDDPTSSTALKDEARIAKRDATNNLRLLKRGITREQPERRGRRGDRGEERGGDRGDGGGESGGDRGGDS